VDDDEQGAATGDTIPITPMTAADIYAAAIDAIIDWYESGDD